MVLNICVKFHDILQPFYCYRADTSMWWKWQFLMSKAITPKLCNPELRFLRSTRCLMVLNICMKFHENILNGLKLQSGHEYVVKIAIFQCSNGNNSERSQSRATVPALCTSSNSA